MRSLLRVMGARKAGRRVMGRAKAVLAEMCRGVLSEDIVKLRHGGREGGTLGEGSSGNRYKGHEVRKFWKQVMVAGAQQVRDRDCDMS